MGLILCTRCEKMSFVLVLCQAKSDGLDLTAFPVLLRVSVSVENFEKRLIQNIFPHNIQRCQIQWVLTGFDRYFIFDLTLVTFSLTGKPQAPSGQADTCDRAFNGNAWRSCGRYRVALHGPKKKARPMDAPFCF